jgi:flagellar M-ring protein FliF
MLNTLALPPQFNQLVERVGGRRQMSVLGIGVGVVIVILAMARWATSPTWVPVSTNLPLESVGPITDKLTEQAIPYKLLNGGTELQVATTDLAKARVALARDGLPSAGRPGLELFDQPSWGMTDFTQRINYRRALEGELERTIGKMQNIETAQVHLALAETAGLQRNNQAAEASVVLRLKGGGSPAPDVVDGIAHLVAGSVDGIDAERVTILDQGGRLLSSPWEPGSAGALASRELTMRSEIEKYLETKADQIVTQIVGPGNARVQISADINLDKVDRTVETVDPDKQVLASEQRSEITPGAQGGAGSTNTSANYLNSRTVETYAGAVGNVRRITAAVLVNDKMDPAVNGGQPQPRTPQELARIQALVQTAIGLDPGRGDVISVVSVPFGAPLPEAPQGMDVWTMVQEGWRPGMMLLGIVFAFVIGMRAMKSFAAPPPEIALAAALPGMEQGEMDQLTGETATMGPDGVMVNDYIDPMELGPPDLPKHSGPTLRDQAIARLEEQPEVSLRLLRAWLKDA